MNSFEGTDSMAITQLPASASHSGQNLQGSSLSFGAFEKVKELNSVEVKPDKHYRKSITMTYDTGAAATAFPLSQEGEYSEPDGSSYRTATGDIVEDEWGHRYRGDVQVRRAHEAEGQARERR